MVFRANEAALDGYERAKNYLVPRKASQSDRSQAEDLLQDIISDCGPVVEAYPTWHPLVAQHDSHSPATYPSTQCGYRGLDHTVCFVNAFITCPYAGNDEILESVTEIKTPHCADLSAEPLDALLYAEGTRPVLVRCEWHGSLDLGGTIPKSLAVPLMLEQELPVWRWAERAETWDTMRPYLLGQPHGNRSSLFVSQDTALAIKKMYISMIETGMFGPTIMR